MTSKTLKQVIEHAVVGNYFVSKNNQVYIVKGISNSRCDSNGLDFTVEQREHPYEVVIGFEQLKDKRATYRQIALFKKSPRKPFIPEGV